MMSLCCFLTWYVISPFKSLWFPLMSINIFMVDFLTISLPWYHDYRELSILTDWQIGFIFWLFKQLDVTLCSVWIAILRWYSMFYSNSLISITSRQWKCFSSLSAMVLKILNAISIAMFSPSDVYLFSSFLFTNDITFSFSLNDLLKLTGNIAYFGVKWFSKE